MTHWKAGGEGDDREQDVEWHHGLNGHEFEQVRWLVMDREAWHATIMWSQRVRHD